MHDWFQKHEQYCTEVAGPWQTRHCDPSEYEATVQELIQMADRMPPYNTTEITWCQTQTKILQNRADYIRQSWAKKEQAKQQAEQARKEADERFNQLLATWQANLQAWQEQSTPPAPQEAPKEEDKKPLYQATVEDVTESTAETESQQQHGSSKLSTDDTPISGDSAACLSNALFFATQHALILMLNTIFGHIQHSQSMEARGEG